MHKPIKSDYFIVEIRNIFELWSISKHLLCITYHECIYVDNNDKEKYNTGLMHHGLRNDFLLPYTYTALP